MLLRAIDLNTCEPGLLHQRRPVLLPATSCWTSVDNRLLYGLAVLFTVCLRRVSWRSAFLVWVRPRERPRTAVVSGRVASTRVNRVCEYGSWCGGANLEIFCAWGLCCGLFCVCVFLVSWLLEWADFCGYPTLKGMLRRKIKTFISVWKISHFYLNCML